VAVVHEQPVAVVAQAAELLVVAAAAVHGQPAAEAEADGPRAAVMAALAYSALGVAVAASAA
jgi:hypothetical protein